MKMPPVKLVPLGFAAGLLLGALTSCGPRQTAGQMCAGALVLKSGPYAGMTPDARCRMQTVAAEGGKVILAPGETLREYCQTRVDAMNSPTLNKDPARKAFIIGACATRLQVEVDQCMASPRQIYAGCMADLNAIDRAAFGRAMAEPIPVFQPDYGAMAPPPPLPPPPVYHAPPFVPSPPLMTPPPPLPGYVYGTPAPCRLDTFRDTHPRICQ